MVNSKNNLLMKTLILGIISLCSISTAMAGGIALGSTRIIYPQNAQQISLPITSNDESKPYLIQSWVSAPDGKKSNDFIITPPIFVIQPNKENTLRIMHVGKKPLPTDRESLFYLTSKAIPSGKPEEGKNILMIATESTIKMFVRPDHLPSASTDAPAMLHCKLSGASITVTNASPYYVTMVNMTAGSQALPNTMVAPKSDVQIPVTGGPGGTIKFKTLNDYGSRTDLQTCTM